MIGCEHNLLRHIIFGPQNGTVEYYNYYREQKQHKEGYAAGDMIVFRCGNKTCEDLIIMVK